MRKVEQLRFLERPGRTLGQAAIQWLLRDPRTLSVLPNIYDEEQLKEFAAASDSPPLEDGEMARIAVLVSENFGLEPEELKHKGEMLIPAELASALA